MSTKWQLFHEEERKNERRGWKNILNWRDKGDCVRLYTMSRIYSQRRKYLWTKNEFERKSWSLSISVCFQTFGLHYVRPGFSPSGLSSWFTATSNFHTNGCTVAESKPLKWKALWNMSQKALQPRDFARIEKCMKGDSRFVMQSAEAFGTYDHLRGETAIAVLTYEHAYWEILSKTGSCRVPGKRDRTYNISHPCKYKCVG